MPWILGQQRLGISSTPKTCKCTSRWAWCALRFFVIVNVERKEKIRKAPSSIESGSKWLGLFLVIWTPYYKICGSYVVTLFGLGTYMWVVYGKAYYQERTLKRHVLCLCWTMCLIVSRILGSIINTNWEDVRSMGHLHLLNVTKHRSIFEWCVTKCKFKNTYQKIHVSNAIGLHAQILLAIIGSTFNIQHN